MTKSFVLKDGKLEAREIQNIRHNRGDREQKVIYVNEVKEK